MKNTIYCFLVYLCIIALSSRAKAQGAGYTLQFDGVNDYVEVAANASLNITSAITIEAWVNKYTNVQWASVMTKGKGSNQSGRKRRFAEEAISFLRLLNSFNYYESSNLAKCFGSLVFSMAASLVTWYDCTKLAKASSRLCDPASA